MYNLTAKSSSNHFDSASHTRCKEITVAKSCYLRYSQQTDQVESHIESAMVVTSKCSSCVLLIVAKKWGNFNRFLRSKRTDLTLEKKVKQYNVFIFHKKTDLAGKYIILSPQSTQICLCH